MKTSKPISTISYNSIDFLISTLERLRYMRFISYYEFIQHLADTDDKKNHIHLYIEPNKSIDTEQFANNFIEYSFSLLIKKHTLYKFKHIKLLKFVQLFSRYCYTSKLKPLKCINWRSSKFGDWYWYALHDKDYLKSKCLVRNCFYTDKDIFSADYDTHLYKVQENPLINYANMSDLALRDFIYQCVAEDKPLQYLLKNCKVPLGKIQSVIHFYNALMPYYSPKKELKQQLPKIAAIKKSRQNIIQTKINDIVNGSFVSVDNDFVFDPNFDDLY